MGDETDADWQAGLSEWGAADAKEYYRAKRDEVDAWSNRMARKARQYVAEGMSHEDAEERACKDIRREIRRS